MAKIVHINPSVLRAVARDLDKSGRDIASSFQAIHARMREVEGAWDSPAGRRVVQRFNAVYDRFLSKFERIMNEHTEFLNRTAQDAIDTEKDRKDDVDKMKNLDAD